MRLVLSVLSISFVAAPLRPQAPLSLQAARLSDSLLVEVLNGSEERDLNKLPGGSQQNIASRLYAVGHSGTCVEETEWVCSYRYVIAVSEYGEAPTQAAFDLGELGEVGNIRWLKSVDPDHALLQIDVRNYPFHAVKQNSKLKLRSRRYKLDISVNGVTITPVS